jgi:hypothetical protein
MAARNYPSLEERFWSRVKKTDGCWEWIGGKSQFGYGQIKFNGDQLGAHRVSLSLAGIDAPSDMFVCHHCDNPGCVNPEHLFLGTHKDNMADMWKKGRALPRRGSAHHNARLIEEDIPRIRDMLACGAKQKEIAELFGVGFNAISEIKLGKKWKHVS